MKKQIILASALIIAITFSPKLKAQDTFSIVAADSATREVGSAGASCVDLFTTSFTDDGFLGDLIPNLCAINTQAAYISTNQVNARTRMNAGDTPAQAIAWLSTNANDVQGNSSTRQYGIVGFTGNNITAAGFTGAGCTNYKNHVTGSIGGIYYSVQGNILLGQLVLDSMEARFRRAEGDLTCRLMAALQGGKMIGADTRCAPNNSSTLFAFIKVSQPTDPYGSPSFKVSVRTHNNAHIEPIDTLQKKFDLIHTCSLSGIQDNSSRSGELSIYPNPAGEELWVMDYGVRVNGRAMLEINNVLGENVYRTQLETKNEQLKTRIDVSSLARGMYIVQLSTEGKTYRARVVKQ